MKSMLKGTYKIKKKMVKSGRKTGKKTFEDFESSAMQKLGGSIAFVSKAAMIWCGDEKTK
jgi:hypothetical protein